MAEKTPGTRVGRVYLDSSRRGKCVVHFGNKQRKNFEELRRLYVVVREIHITRFPYNKFYILIIKML
jgi:hypothetical protein